MNRTEYKNNFYKEHYERINLAVPKGMKDIIRTLAADKGMSINAYIQDLVRKASAECSTRCRLQKRQGNDFRNHWKHARRI